MRRLLNLIACIVSAAAAPDCADSTSWWYKKTKNTCEDYVAKKAKYCKEKCADEDGVSSIEACPVTCDACPIWPCVDSTSWFTKKLENDCEYVAKKSKRCKSKITDPSDVSALQGCPLTCGECEAEVSDCADSTSWYFKKTDRDCGYVAKKTEARCKVKNKDDDGVDAFAACPAACDACVDAQTSAPTACADSTSWFTKKDAEYDCVWVAKKEAGRCGREDDIGVLAADACCASCGGFSAGNGDEPILASPGAPVALVAGAASLVRTRTTGELFTLTRVADGVSAPSARSYDGRRWEASTRPATVAFECDGDACATELDADAEGYVLEAFSGAEPTGEALAFRLLAQGTFGPTEASLAAAAAVDPSAWLAAQMDVEPTLHRSHYRRRSNAHLPRATDRHGAYGPCDAGSRWSRHAVDQDDIGATVELVGNDLYVGGFFRTQVDDAFEIIGATSDAICYVSETVAGDVRLGDCEFNDHLAVGADRVAARAGGYFPNPEVVVDSVARPHPSAEMADLTPAIAGSKIAVSVDAACDATAAPSLYARDSAEPHDAYRFDRRLRFADNAALAAGDADAARATLRRTCASAPRSFFNAGDCARSPECAAPAYDSTPITLDDATIRAFYEAGGSYVYRVSGLRPHTDLAVSWPAPTDSPCDVSDLPHRWVRRASDASACGAVSGLDADAEAALAASIAAALAASSAGAGRSARVVDVDARDEGLCVDQDRAAVGASVTVGDYGCWEHAHNDEWSVYDLSEWATGHDGNGDAFAARRPNPIEAFARRGEATLEYPTWHPMDRWASAKWWVAKLGNYGDVVAFSGLPVSVQSAAVAAALGAAAAGDGDAGHVVCASPGEVGNDPSLGHRYSAYRAAGGGTPNTYDFDGYVGTNFESVWFSATLGAGDQLRQRVAWALSQIFVVGAQLVEQENQHEALATYYDIFLRNAFGTFEDVLRDVSFSPLMGDMLTYAGSKSRAYSVEVAGDVFLPDENFAREIMQLFTIGLTTLASDGTPAGGATYDIGDIVTLARAWTGFDRASRERGNIESSWSTAFPQWNNVDPMVVGPGRDAYPKRGLAVDGAREYIGDGVATCASAARDRAWLKAGAKWSLLGSTARPTMHTPEPKWWRLYSEPLTLTLEPATSSLWAALCGADGDGSECAFHPEVVLGADVACDGTCAATTVGGSGGACECSLDAPRVVRVAMAPAEPAYLYYEYVPEACVDYAFASNYRTVVQPSWNGVGVEALCADADDSLHTSLCCYDSHSWGTPVGLFANERVLRATSEARCEALGARPCTTAEIGVPDYVNFLSVIDESWMWTDDACSLEAQVDAGGNVNIVHAVPERYATPLTFDVDSGNGFAVIWGGEAEAAAADGNFGAGDGAAFYPTVEGGCVGCETRAHSCLCDAVVDGDTVRVGGGLYAFKNPPSFHSTTERPAHGAPAAAYHETLAVLSHLVAHPNVGPFIGHLLIQRLVTSNPSPRYVEVVAGAFDSGTFEAEDGARFGTGARGDLAATVAAVLLDPEARSATLEGDAFAGGAREPLLRIAHLARALDLGGAGGVDQEIAPQGFYDRLGMAPVDAPSVFNFYQSDFAPYGPVGDAALVSPEGQLLVAPKVVGYLNGVASLAFHGLNNWDGGLGSWTYNVVGAKSGDAEISWDASGTAPRLRYAPASWGGATNVNGASAAAVVADLDRLLTGGRLGDAHRIVIETAYARAAAFAFHDRWATWEAASAACAARGAALASPCSAEENAAARATFSASDEWEDGNVHSIWLGVDDRDDEGAFARTDGRDCAYDAWAPGQPDDGGAANWGGEDCGSMIFTGEWNDLPCGVWRQYACAGDHLAALATAVALFAAAPEFATTNAFRDGGAAREADAKGEGVADPEPVADYKAIVYLFLSGGADSFSMLVPHAGCDDAAEDPSLSLDAQYRSVRGDVALDAATVLEIDANGDQPCETFGVHPSFANAREMYEAGDLAFLSNIGPLVEPIVNVDGLASAPPSLFAHNVQTACVQTVHAQNAAADGVLGRFGDALAAQRGDNGASFAAYSIASAEPKVLEGAPGTRDPADVLASSGVAGLVGVASRVEGDVDALLARTSTSAFGETYAQRTASALDRATALGDLLDATAPINGPCARVSGDDDGPSDLARQLDQVARLARGRDALGADRAVFYVTQGFYDTHSDNGPAYAALSARVDDALACFRDEMEAQGLWGSVAIVQASEFGRTLTSNGRGTDHGWGGNAFVASGALRGGRVLGAYPDDLSDASPRSLGQGRMIPTTPWEALWLAVGAWFGVDDDRLRTDVLPNLANFPSDVHLEDLFET